MMKNILKIIFVMALINTGCNAQKNSLITNVEAAGSGQPVEDSLLQKLQAENDLIVAYAVEKFAWGRSMDFQILAQKNDAWKGYVYHKNLMTNTAGSPTSINRVTVDNTACNALLNYITENKAWNIKGDSGDGFCKTENRNCNINDAPGLRLWIVTKKAVINPYYYAPDFYEKCCPDEQRGLFLTITKKIAAAVGDESNQ